MAFVRGNNTVQSQLFFVEDPEGLRKNWTECLAFFFVFLSWLWVCVGKLSRLNGLKRTYAVSFSPDFAFKTPQAFFLQRLVASVLFQSVRTPLAISSCFSRRKYGTALLTSISSVLFSKEVRERSQWQQQRRARLTIWASPPIPRCWRCSPDSVSFSFSICLLAAFFILFGSGGGNERVIFTDKVDKINRKGKLQQRILILTSRGIYNCKGGSYKCQRRITLETMHSITVNPTENKFVLHIMNDYDYYFHSQKSAEIVQAILTAVQTATSRLIPKENTVGQTTKYACLTPHLFFLSGHDRSE